MEIGFLPAMRPQAITHAVHLLRGVPQVTLAERQVVLAHKKQASVRDQREWSVG